ncbi:hypothetical protein IFM89_004385 [Coptis chinensis]|uniref:Uncharacterized protein n=1 Tax=Coptis chinensis TaxID=261450 RepID=A0A835LTW1_9MAGN|nr:hypothetical protein IFM89_004385 [Coptis chinensis]
MECSFTGKEISGVGNPGFRVYELLAGLTLVCASCCFYLSLRPTAFFVEVVLCCGLVFKGTWVLQAGLSLYTDTFSPKGCRKISLLESHVKSNVQCELEEDGLRGVALIDLLFVVHAIGILVMCFVLFGTLSCNRHLRCGSYSALADIESESLLVRPLPEVESE